MNKYYIKTYGCQMNIADSERLAGVLESAGYEKAQAEAQVIWFLKTPPHDKGPSTLRPFGGTQGKQAQGRLPNEHC